MNFMYSCISEGLIPAGFRHSFTMANDVNNEDFVKLVQEECNKQSSRLLDIFMKRRNDCLMELQEKYENLLENLRETIEAEVLERIKNETYQISQRRGSKLKKKLIQLRNDRQRTEN